jgi:hypothetical protein
LGSDSARASTSEGASGDNGSSASLELGTQSYLVEQNSSMIDQYFLPSQIPSLKVTWYREWVMEAAKAGNFAHAAVKARQSGMKVLAVVPLTSEDFSAAPHYKDPWGRGVYALSELDVPKFKARLRAYLDALKAGGATVDAFEIGNELGSTVFNADFPTTRMPASSDVQKLTSSYARFLKASLELILADGYFPRADIISFAPLDNLTQGPGYLSVENALKSVAGLGNVDGVNYLNYLTGFGLHLYPSSHSKTGDAATNLALATAALDAARRILGASKPVWITEWGFELSCYTKTPTATGCAYSDSTPTKSQMVSGFLDLMRASQSKIHLGPLIQYSYYWPYWDYDLVSWREGDPCFGNAANLCGLQPEAKLLGQYNTNLSRVDLRWDHDDPENEYSLDISLKGGETIAPCVGSAILGRSLGYQFDGICGSAAHRHVSADQVQSVRVCGSKDGWKSSVCSPSQALAAGQRTVRLKIAPESSDMTYLSWNPVPGAVYSVDVQPKGGTWIAPCVGSATIGSALAYSLGRVCSASGAVVPASTVNAVRVCASVDNWKSSKCVEKSVAGQRTYPVTMKLDL